MMHEKSDINIESSLEELKSEGVSHRRENMLILKILAVVVISASAIIVLFLVFSKSQQQEESFFAVAYSKAGVDYCKSSEGEFKLPSDRKSKTIITKDGKRLFYFTASQINTSKLDLYCCELTSKRKISKGGYMVDSGIGSDISVDFSGNFVIYSKKNDSTGENTFYLYNTEKKNSTKIDSNILDIYILPGIQCAYFTKILNSEKALFKYVFNNPPEKIAAKIKEVNYFESVGKSILIYETNESNAEGSDLYLISGLDEKLLISSNVSDVLYEKYSAGGNLYYFKASVTNINWENVIPDDIKLEDSQITEPNKDDYKFIFGYSYKYRKALIVYNEKLGRDDLRSALNRLIEEDNLIAAYFDCYAYNSTGTFKVGEGVSPESIYCVSIASAPSAVFAKDGYEESKVKFSKLCAMLDNSDINKVTAYASDIIKNSTASQGVHIAYPEHAEGLDLKIDENEALNCEFRYSADGNDVFVMIKDADAVESTFFKISVKDGNISQREVIDANITSFDFSADTVWYLKNGKESSEGPLFSYSAGNIKLAVDAVYSFISFEDNSVLFFQNHTQNQSGLSADLYRFSGDSSILMSNNVDLRSLRSNGSKDLSFIRNYNSDTGGELCVFVGDKMEVIESDVSEILLY